MLSEDACGVFFGARVLLGPRAVPSELDERAWRYVDLSDAGEPLRDELRILERVRCAEGTPRELPGGVAPRLYELWETTQRQILDEYAERLDPASASGSTRIPSSQSWAIQLLADEGSAMAEAGLRASTLREAESALSVPRSPLVLRRLSALRRQLRDGDFTPAAAALGVLEVVEAEGLRPVEDSETVRISQLGPDRVRLVCYQVVSG